MRYLSFRIRNFKGIKDTVVDLRSVTGANVFALVGLNESGKTTILEAIHTFSPDYRSGLLVGFYQDFENYEDIVPKHAFSTFSGNISIEATLALSSKDKIFLSEIIGKEFKIDQETIKETIQTSFEVQFSRGDFVRSYRTVRGDFKVLSPNGKVPRPITDKQREAFADHIYMNTPDIAYYPTFIFDFPDKIWLTDRGGETNRFYRAMFADVLAYGGADFDINRDILSRVRSENFVLPFLEFLQSWRGSSNKDKIRHVVYHAQKIVTDVVFGRWNDIFREDASGKEVIIDFDIEEGKVKNSENRLVSTEKHDPYIKFRVKDGTRLFDVNDRSLGFRWFFAFLLFTQFRSARDSARPVLFLFDEPASNLHSAAQRKLVEAFPEIARDRHMLMYSTHSHYMIDPKWLEQTFIVTNRADSPGQSVIDSALLDDQSLDIKATRYRSFIEKDSNQTSYFQPIIDRLNVVPSDFDYSLPSIVLEGKSDYYILKYVQTLVGRKEPRLIPGLGAGTFGALIGISAGWGTKFLFLLDADAQGLSERQRYALEHGAREEALVTLNQISSELTEIEDLFDDNARAIIKNSLSIIRACKKKDILRFCQEHLARGDVLELGDEFRRRAIIVLEGLSERLERL